MSDRNSVILRCRRRPKCTRSRSGTRQPRRQHRAMPQRQLRLRCRRQQLRQQSRLCGSAHPRPPAAAADPDVPPARSAPGPTAALVTARHAPSSGPVATAPLVSHATAVSFSRASLRIPCNSTSARSASACVAARKCSSRRLRQMVEHNPRRYARALLKARHDGRHAVNVIETQPLRQLTVATDDQRSALQARPRSTPPDATPGGTDAAPRCAPPPGFALRSLPSAAARQPAPPPARCHRPAAAAPTLRPRHCAPPTHARAAPAHRSQAATPPTTRTATAPNPR